MISAGKSRRLSRILPGGANTIIVPIDHGYEGFYPELSNAETLIRKLNGTGVDAFLLRRGIIDRIAPVLGGSTGIIYRITGATGREQHALTDQRILSSVEEAIRYGADAIVYTVTAGHPRENEMLTSFCLTVEHAESLGIPVIGEVDIYDSGSAGAWEDARRLTRSLGEEGADMVKTYFPGGETHCSDIISYSIVPVLAAGGQKMSSPEEVLHFVEAVMHAGAAGPCIGRNIWQYRNPESMVRALYAIVKEGKSASEASREL